MREAFKILFEDEFILVLEKQAKILVQPSPKKEKHTLTTLLEEKIKQKAYPCHRLDRETTGLIIYAKGENIQRAIMEQFRRNQVKKKYIALVKGVLKKDEGMLEGFILDKEGKRFQEKPKKAKTYYRVLRKTEGFSVIDLKPLTGRTNQLRIQFAKIGHPILGERKYAFGRDFRVNFKRLALHAYFLSFIHPVSKERLQFRIELPQDMKTFLLRMTESKKLM